MQILGITLCILLIANCDIFNNPVDPNYLDNIREEIIWANADKLTVRLNYPQEWGSSNPVQGDLSNPQNPNAPMDIRRWDGVVRDGIYWFNMEFTPFSGFYFVEWLAFDSNQYETAILSGSLEDAKAHGSFIRESGLIPRGLPRLEET